MAEKHKGRAPGKECAAPDTTGADDSATGVQAVTFPAWDTQGRAA